MNDLPLIRLDSNADRAETAGWAGRAQRTVGVISCDPSTLVTTARMCDWKSAREWDDPFNALRWMAEMIGPFADNPYGEPRWVGYLSYDLGRLFERLPIRAADDLGLPLFRFALVTTAHRDPLEPAPRPMRARRAPPTSTFSRPAYEAAVARCVEYIAAGDAFQVNLSQRFTLAAPSPARDVYRRLMAAGGARYGALLQFEDFALVSHSPELFLRVTPDPATGKRAIVTRPIKGTRPLEPGMDVRLRDSAKDQAELNMIVDLERNDLGRVCEIGSVRVTEARTIEAHPTVYHGAATVEGVLRDDVSFVDLLRATFPGGSITGAPKIRAMEIIEELEPVRRGPYCGAIGYLAADGSMAFNVAIRTIVMKDGVAHVAVGGGIVADSEPAAEYEETLVKARAMFAGLGVGPLRGEARMTNDE